MKMEMERKGDLEDLILLCDSKAVADDKCFSELIEEAQRVFSLSDGECADFLCVSRSSIGRWKSGKTLPRPLIRNFACVAFSAKAKKILEDASWVGIVEPEVT
jgi:hypothetical protein